MTCSTAIERGRGPSVCADTRVGSLATMEKERATNANARRNKARMCVSSWQPLAWRLRLYCVAPLRGFAGPDARSHHTPATANATRASHASRMVMLDPCVVAGPDAGD